MWAAFPRLLEHLPFSSVWLRAAPLGIWKVGGREEPASPSIFLSGGAGPHGIASSPQRSCVAWIFLGDLAPVLLQTRLFISLLWPPPGSDFLTLIAQLLHHALFT